MFVSLIAFALALGGTAAAVIALRPIAFAVGLVDRPGGRKHHEVVTPLTGGLALAFGMGLSLVLLGQEYQNLTGLALAGMAVLLLGCADDRFDLRWHARLAAQFATALALVQLGDVRIEMLGPIFGSTPLALGPLSTPFSVLAIVGLINAMNMCDGVDGLAGALSASALTMIGAAAIYSGNYELAMELAVVLGAVVGFLAFNLRLPWQPRARAFLGDSGSGLLGLVIAWASVRLTQDAGHPVAPILAPFMIALPVIDCLVLIIRRTARGGSPFAADRGHLHHLMSDAGWRPSDIVRTLVGVSLMLGLAGGLCLWAKLPPAWFMGGFVGLLGAYLIVSFRTERAVRLLRMVGGRPVASSATPGAGARVVELVKVTTGAGGPANDVVQVGADRLSA